MADIISKNSKPIISTPKVKKTFRCEVCSSTCSSKSNLKDHVASVHEGKKPFKTIQLFQGWRSTWNQFMKARKHSNVQYVKKAIPKIVIWTHTWNQSMMEKGHSNVTFVTTAQVEWMS